jgi:hypothetical protein
MRIFFDQGYSMWQLKNKLFTHEKVVSDNGGIHTGLCLKLLPDVIAFVPGFLIAIGIIPGVKWSNFRVSIDANNFLKFETFGKLIEFGLCFGDSATLYLPLLFKTVFLCKKQNDDTTYSNSLYAYFSNPDWLAFFTSFC